MLLRFRVANHASLLEEQELSLVASDGEGDVATAAVPGTNLLALPVVAVFGANASGKSNVLHALAHMQDVVSQSHRNWPPEGGVRRFPFLLSRSGRESPSTYVADLVVDGVRYEYGFSLNDERVIEEWLYSYPQRRRRILFERNSDGPIHYGDTFTGRRKVIEDIVRPNSLYLSAGASNNHPVLMRLYQWFCEDIGIATDANYERRFGETVRRWEVHDRRRIEDLLRFADLGVETFTVVDEDSDDEEVSRILQAVRILDPDFVHDEAFVRRFKKQRRVQLTHRGSEGLVAFDPSRESSGTRTWAGLLGPIVSALSRGSVLVIDELDARLHPLLAGRLIGLFQSPKTNPQRAQLIFNSHDATLLSPQSEARLRRDQLWVTEKKPTDAAGSTSGATELIPLIEYRPRGQVENFEKRYLSGRYGGLPYFDEELIDGFASTASDQGISLDTTAC